MVSLSKNKTLIDWNRQLLIVRVVARRLSEGTEGTTEFIVRLPSLLAPVLSPSVAAGKIDLERQLSVPLITLNADTNPEDFTLELLGGDLKL